MLFVPDQTVVDAWILQKLVVIVTIKLCMGPNFHTMNIRGIHRYHHRH